MSTGSDREESKDLWASWLELAKPMPWMQAPQNLFQEILRGWVFANQVVINENNSSAPETERAILARESYGRQLGKILEAVAVLVKDRQGKPDRGDEAEAALDDLVTLHDKVSRIKKENLRDRLEQINHDLDALKKADKQAYRRLVSFRNDELAKG